MSAPRPSDAASRFTREEIEEAVREEAVDPRLIPSSEVLARLRKRGEVSDEKSHFTREEIDEALRAEAADPGAIPHAEVMAKLRRLADPQ